MPRIQLEVVANITASAFTPPNQKPGDVVWVNTAEGARHLIEHGLCRLMAVEPPKPAAPSEPRRPMRNSMAAPLDRFAVVDRAWEGETVVCIGGGPSLTEQQVAVVAAARSAERCKVIVINDAYLLAPWADIVYFADHRWWEWHTRGTPKSWPWAQFTLEQVKKAFADFNGQKVTIHGTGQMVKDPKIFMLRNHSEKTMDRSGLSEEPNGLRTGSNGGYQVINLAVLTGAKRILLLGYDMRFQGKRSHSHNGHAHQVPEAAYTGWARNFATMLPQLNRLGVGVINCSPGSAIQAFARGDIASVLPNT